MLILGACSSSGAKDQGEDTTSTNSGSGGSTSSHSSTGSVTIDEGTGKVSVSASSEPKLAYFIVGQNNSYLVAEANGAKAAAKNLGAHITVFDAQFDINTQIAQIQDAKTTAKYDAFIVNPVDGKVQCDELSKSLLHKQVPVSIVVTPICNRGLKDGTETWQPGTLNFLGGTEGVAQFRQLTTQAIKANPGKQTVAFIGGPQNNGTVETALAGLHAASASDPGFNLVAKYYTDFSPGQGLARAQTLLQAYPDTNIIFSNYSGITQGIVTALKSAGKLKKIKIYDGGGDKFDVQQMQAGVVSAFNPYFPYSVGYAAVDQMVKALHGDQGPRFIGRDGHAPVKGTVSSQYPVITPDILANFKAQY